MGEFRRFPKTDARQIIDYNQFADATGEKIIICLDRGVMLIARYFLNSRGSWKSTYSVEINEAGYTTPSNEQMELVLNAIAEANEDMSTCDEINNSLQDIVSAINGLQSSSSDCGCIADSGQDVTEVNDNPDTAIPGPTDPLPPGFDTREEYNTYRCDAANWIVDNYIQTLRNWATLFGVVGGLTLAVISGLLLLTVPPVGLVLILSALGILVGVDIGLLAVLEEIADELEAVRQDIVCALYNAATTDEARQALVDAGILAVDTVGPTPDDPFYAIVTNLASNEQMEALFGKDADIDGYGGDCSTCLEPLWQVEVVGGVGASIVSGNLAEGCVLESAYVFLFGANREYMQIATTTHPENRYLKIVSVPDEGPAYHYTVYASDTPVIDEDSTDWSDLLAIEGDYSGIQIYGASETVNSFQVEFDFVE